MNTADLIEYTVNVLAQYRHTHLSLSAAIWELEDIKMPDAAIMILLEYEERKQR